jgi:hypothetical protein
MGAESPANAAASFGLNRGFAGLAVEDAWYKNLRPRLPWAALVNFRSYSVGRNQQSRYGVAVVTCVADAAA